jgi:ADP-heptose:LPS heptosyltransferase
MPHMCPRVFLKIRGEAAIGLGDNLIATGMARGAHARGKRIAFGDGQQIIWDNNSETIFRGNPNIAAPGDENAADIEWIAFHRGHRIYNRQGANNWIWNYDFRPIPGEFYFSDDELRYARRQHGRGFIVIEPSLPPRKGSSPNKDWGFKNYLKLAQRLTEQGHVVRQFKYSGVDRHIDHVRPHIKPPTFRHAAAVLANAALYIGPEGGLHHAAAAVGIPAVVLFGAWIPPQVTGYDTHTNISVGGSYDFCGSLKQCDHCREAMARISVDEVEAAALGILEGAEQRAG